MWNPKKNLNSDAKNPVVFFFVCLFLHGTLFCENCQYCKMGQKKFDFPTSYIQWSRYRGSYAPPPPWTLLSRVFLDQYVEGAEKMLIPSEKGPQCLVSKILRILGPFSVKKFRYLKILFSEKNFCPKKLGLDNF